MTVEDAPIDRTDALPMPTLTRRMVDACSFASWYPKFRRVSPKATIIPLPDDFIKYLKEDGVFLLETDEADSTENGDDEEGDAHSQSSSEDDAEETARPKYDFRDLNDQIKAVIADYEAVFPKLNWSSPQDAAWMVAGPPLKCMTPDDVYLLLKASDFIIHDLGHAYDACEDRARGDHTSSYHLVLKKWFSMPKSHEFRCFVRNQNLIAIAQRDTNYYDFLQDRQRQSDFAQLVINFFNEKIQGPFEEANYIFDVYITRDEAKVFLIDFNSYSSHTDTLLFDWSELQSIQHQAGQPIFRVVESEAEASQSMPRYSHNRYPKDVVGLSDGTSIAEFAKNWREALDEVVPGQSPSTASADNVEVPGR